MNSPERQFNALTSDQDKSSNEIKKTTETVDELRPIIETETSISYLGVKLEKAEVRDSQFVPKREQYADFINDKEVALPLQRDIAVAFLNGEPLLIEGGTSLGKTTTVRKMAAELGYEVHYANLNGATDVEDLMGRYIPNPHKNKPEDPEYIFADGKVTSGLRQEEGKIKIIILDEFNSAAPNILIRLHEVLDALERGGDVILSEDASESISVNKEKTKIVALMNPVGKGYLGREPLDPAQLRRWVYKKMPSELPVSTFSYSTDALFKAGPESQYITPDMFLKSREDALTLEQLSEIPGMREVLEKYKEFHKAAKELVKSRKIAEDQSQPFIYDDRMEPRRVRDFVLRFYNGDINETFQQALRYYYANKLESDVDRKKLEELIRLVEYRPKTIGSQRRGTEREEKLSVGESISKHIEVAIEKLGKENVFGPKEIEKVFGVKIEDVPDIPFSVEELERAKNLNQMLILRVDKTAEGKPMSIKAMSDILDKKWQDEGRGRLLNLVKNWMNWLGESSFTQESPRAGWALVSKDVLPDSLGKNYLEQTEVVIKTLKEEVFKDLDIPEEYAEAITEFENKKAEIVKLMDKDWTEAAQELLQLKITQLTRQTAAEAIYDLAVYYDINNKRLLADRLTWLAFPDSHCRLVQLGCFSGNGVSGLGLGWSSFVQHPTLGTCLSRRL